MGKSGNVEEAPIEGGYTCGSGRLTVLAAAAGAPEWENVTCPICLEPPHNAVLLRCSSYGQGCRSYICNTSYRHSNCLDKFVRSSAPCPSNQQVGDAARSDEGVVSSEGFGFQSTPPCPFCRGKVLGWFVDKKCRLSMDSKPRACSFEDCDFSGTYADLRKHARVNHPSARPSDVNPERQENWAMMERQNEISELLRMIIPETYSEAEEDLYDSLEEDDTDERMSSALFGMVTNTDSYTQMVAALLLPAIGFDDFGAHNIIISTENSNGDNGWETELGDWSNMELTHDDHETLSISQSHLQRTPQRRDNILRNINTFDLSLENTVYSRSREEEDVDWIRSNLRQFSSSNYSSRNQRFDSRRSSGGRSYSYQRSSRRWRPYNDHR